MVVHFPTLVLGEVAYPPVYGKANWRYPQLPYYEELKGMVEDRGKRGKAHAAQHDMHVSSLFHSQSSLMPRRLLKRHGLGTRAHKLPASHSQ